MDDSEEEMDYSDDDMSEMGDDGSDDDVGFADGPPVQRQESTFTPLDNEGLRVMAGNRVDEVMELLCCDRNVAAMLLRFFRWDQEKLMEGAPPAPLLLPPVGAFPRRPLGLACTAAEYLLNPESTLKKVGMASPGQDDRSVIHQGDQAPILVGGVEKPRSSMPAQKCLVCYDEATVYSALACGHAFCNQCYGTYLEHKIADEGHACIFARCPDEKAPAPPHLSAPPRPRPRPRPARHAPRRCRPCRAPC